MMVYNPRPQPDPTTAAFFDRRDAEIKDYGGQAFPNGMTLRDWFAGQALQAIILADGITFASNETAHAEFAYRQADAMLKARRP